MATTFTSLPSEIVAAVLSHLSVSSLLMFSATNRSNQALALSMLQDLDLAVFSRDIHCRLAFVSQNRVSTSPYDDGRDGPQKYVSKTTGLPIRTTKKDSDPTSIFQRQVSAQNEIAASILNKPSVQSLRSLSLQMYEVRSSEVTSAIARKLPKLKHLELRFSHPYIHDQTLGANYWREAPEGNPCWNSIAGLGIENQRALRLHSLQTLRIERAGLTSVQLRKLIAANPRLREIHLNNVTGVDLEFANWLGAYCESGKSKLEKIELENCSRLQMQRLEDFAWLSGLTESESQVKHLSLWMCRNVRSSILDDLIEHGEDEGFELDAFEMLVPPRGSVRRYGAVVEKDTRHASAIFATSAEGVEKNLVTGTGKIDVDPEYMALPTMIMA